MRNLIAALSALESAPHGRETLAVCCIVRPNRISKATKTARSQIRLVEEMSESRTFSVSIKDCLVKLLALGDLYESIATGENDNGFRIRADEAAAVMRASAYFISDFAASHREWVSVEERLPEMGVRVMVAHAVDGWVGVGERVLTGAYLHWEDDGEDLHEPTHWMPLPSPPPKKD